MLRREAGAYNEEEDDDDANDEEAMEDDRATCGFAFAGRELLLLVGSGRREKGREGGSPG
jgi:hypothetical protein